MAHVIKLGLQETVTPGLKSIENELKRLNSTTANVASILGKFSTEGAKVAQATEKVEKSVKKNTTALGSFSNSFNKTTSVIRTFTGQTTNTTNVFSRLLNSVKGGNSTFNSMSSNVQTANSSLRSLNSTANSGVSAFGKLGSSIKSFLAIVGGLKLIQSAFRLISNSVSSAIDRLDTMSTFERKMTMITGSTDTAKQALDALNDATTDTSYKLVTSTKAVQNFVTRGLSMDAAVKSTSIWMDAVSAYGRGTDDEFETVTDAIAKMRTKGTVEMKQLNRLFQVGINPVQMYAKAVGSTQEEIQEALSAKNIKADEFISVVETAMREGTNGVIAVEGMAKKAGSTWKAALSNSLTAIGRGTAEIIDTLDKFFEAFNENGLRGVIVSTARGIEKALKGIASGLNALLTPLKNFIQNIRSSLNTVGPAFDPLTQSINRAKTAISNFHPFKNIDPKTAQNLQKIGQGIGKVFKAVIQVLADLVPPALDAINHVIDLGKEFLNAHADSFAEGLGNIAEKLPGMSGGIANALPIVFALVAGLRTGTNFAFGLGKALQFVTELKAGNTGLGKMLSTMSPFKNGKKTESTKVEEIVNIARTTKTKTSGTKDSLVQTGVNLKNLYSDSKAGQGINKIGSGFMNMFKRVGGAGKEMFSGLWGGIDGGSGLNVILKPFQAAGGVIKQMFTGLWSGIDGGAGLNVLFQPFSKPLVALEPLKGALLGLLGPFAAILAILAPVVVYLLALGKTAQDVDVFFANLNSTIAGFGASISSFFTGLVNTVTNMDLAKWGEMGGFMMSSLLSGIVSSAMTFIATLGNIVINAVMSLIQMAPSFISAGISFIGSLIVGLLQKIPDLLGYAIDIVLGWVDNISRNLPNLIQSGIDMVVALIGGIVTWVPKIFVAVGQFMLQIPAKILEYIPKIIKSGVQLIINLIVGIVKGFMYIPQAIGNLVNYIRDNWQEGVKWFADMGGKAIEWIFNGLVEGAKYLITGGWLKDLWNMISDAWNDTQDGLDVDVNVDSTSATKSTEDVVDNLDTVKETASQAGYAIQEVVDSTTEIDLAEDGYDTGVDWASNLTDGMTDTFDSGELYTSVDNGMQDLIDGLGDTLSDVSQQTGTAIATSFRNVIDNGQAYAIGSDLINEINRGITENFESTYMLASTWAGNIAAVIKAEVNTVDVIEPFISSNEELVNNAKETGNNIQTYMETPITGMKGNVLSTVEDLAKELPKKLKNTPSQFNQLGQDIWDDFISGMNDKKTDVLKATEDLVNALKDKFTQGLGIHSPSRVVAYYGSMAGAGWIKGLSDSDAVKMTGHFVDLMKASFRNGKFDPAELVNYLDDDSLKVVEYLVRNGDATTSEAVSAVTGVKPLIGDYQPTYGFGTRNVSVGSKNHAGMDIPAPAGTQIVASHPGTVTVAGEYFGYGNAVVIDHGNGMQTIYGHMSKVQAQKGQTVTAGQAIGLVGTTGVSTGNHLHYEVRQNGTPIDPSPYWNGGVSLGGATNTLAGVIQQAYNEMKGLSVAGSNSIMYNASAGVEQWRGTALQALQMMGLPSSLVNNVLSLMQGESSGDPNSIQQVIDINSGGNEARGLMQMTPSTFRAYALPGYNTNIYDPLSNILASLNYQIKRYGYIRSTPGYAVGTRNVPYDMMAQIHKGEAILPKSQNPYSKSGGDYLGEIGSSIGQSVMNTLTLNPDSGLKLDLSDIQSSGNNNNYNSDNRQFSNNPNIVINSDNGEQIAQQLINQLDDYFSRMILSDLNTYTAN